MTALRQKISDITINNQLIQTIRKLMQEANINEATLCRRTNIPQATLHKILTGKTADPRFSTLQTIGQYFNVTVDQLFNGVPIADVDDTQAIPVVTWEDCVKGSSFIYTLTANNWQQWITFESTTEHSFALTSKPSMEPRFPKGTALIIDPKTTAQDGDLVVVLYPNTHQATLRELSADGPCTYLLSLGNSMTQDPIDDVKIIGVVIESRFFHHN